MTEPTPEATVCPVIKGQVEISGWVNHEDEENEGVGAETLRLEENKREEIERRKREAEKREHFKQIQEREEEEIEAAAERIKEKLKIGERERQELEIQNEIMKEKTEEYEKNHFEMMRAQEKVRLVKMRGKAKKESEEDMIPYEKWEMPKRVRPESKKGKTPKALQETFKKWRMEEGSDSSSRESEGEDDGEWCCHKQSEKQIEREPERRDDREEAPITLRVEEEPESELIEEEEEEGAAGIETPKGKGRSKKQTEKLQREIRGLQQQLVGDIGGRDLYRLEKPERRSKREINAPTRYTQYPILVKEGEARYIPWSSQDMQNVITSLPLLRGGAGHWIRVLEEETTGRILAIGDLKALLGKIVGRETMLDIFHKAGFNRDHVGTTKVDGIPLDRVRARTWAALRVLYPSKPDLANLAGPPLKSSETPSEYIDTQQRRWRMILEKDVQDDPIMTSIFRKAIIDKLPAEVGRRLEEVVGLKDMTHAQFVTNVEHAMERHQNESKRLEDQTKDIQRKLFQMQLEELNNKAKKARELNNLEKEKETKKVASVKVQNMDNGFFDFEMPPMPDPRSSPKEPRLVVNYNFSGTSHPVATQGNMQGGGQNVGGNQGNQGKGGPGNGGQQNQKSNTQNQNWGQQGYANAAKKGPIVCYGCGQPGHIKRQCPYQNNQGTGAPVQPQQMQAYPPVAQPLNQPLFVPPPQPQPQYQAGGPVNYQGAQ